MEIKNLAREQMLAEIVAERDSAVLELNEKVFTLQAKIKVKDAEIEDLKATVNKKKKK